METLGWRCWYEDDAIYTSAERTWESLPDDGIVVKIIYYSNGGRQAQQADWYYEAPHEHGTVRGTCTDGKREETEKRYPGAIFKRGKWVPDEYFREVCDVAVVSEWNDGN